MKTKKQISKRLEYLRGEIKAERISMDEIIELQSLAPHIEPGDTDLLEWAGVPEKRLKVGKVGKVSKEKLSKETRQVIKEVIHATEKHSQAVCGEDNPRLQDVIDGMDISLQKLRGLL